MKRSIDRLWLQYWQEVARGCTGRTRRAEEGRREGRAHSFLNMWATWAVWAASCWVLACPQGHSADVLAAFAGEESADALGEGLGGHGDGAVEVEVEALEEVEQFHLPIL